MKSKEIHVVTARRWGSNDGHNYLVGAFSDLEKAKAAADSHCQYRGGKYSCFVETVIDGQVDDDAVHYSTETYKAKGIEPKAL